MSYMRGFDVKFECSLRMNESVYSVSAVLATTMPVPALCLIHKHPHMHSNVPSFSSIVTIPYRLHH